MSLMMDKDYLILSLRLAYLRRVDDHVGPRVITVPDIVNLPNRSGSGIVQKKQLSNQYPQQTHVSQSSRKQQSSLDFEQNGANTLGLLAGSSSGTVNALRNQKDEILEEEYANSMLPPYPVDSHVVIAGLNDARKYPELTTICSPKLINESLKSVQESNEEPFLGDSSELMDGHGELKDVNRARAASLGASGLKHTTTIYGPGRSGALGMRVSGRRNVSIEGRRRKGLRDGAEVILGEESQALQKQRKLGPSRKRSVESSLLERSNRNRSSDHSSTSTAIDGTPSERSSLLAHPSQGIPQVAIQSSSQDLDEYGETSKRSKSLRIPSNSSDAASTSLVADMNAIKLRNRSSSQPHRPGFPSNLSNLSVSKSEHGVPSSESRSSQHHGSTMSGGIEALRPSTIEQKQPAAVHSSTSVSKVTPPPRPARRQRTSISEHSVHSASSVPISSTTDDSPQVAIDGRQRSQSEAIMPGSMPPVRPTTVQIANDTQDLPQEPSTTTLGSASYMGRTQSESTIFSLASPRVTRQRGLSNRSLQSDGSIRSGDASALAEKQSLLSKPFAPVAEDPETQFFSDKVDQLKTEVLQGSENVDDGSSAYLLSPFNVQERGQSEFGSFLHDAERLSARGTVSSSVSTVPTSSQQAIAPIATALGIDQGYVSASLTPGLSSTGAGSGVLEKAVPSKPIQSKSVDFTSRTPSPFTKTDSISLKKQFDSKLKRSALTALLSNPSERPNNPFNQHYKSVAGSSVSTGNSLVVEVYFPFAKKGNAVSNASKPRSGALGLNPSTRSMRLSVRKDATMEELIGYSLYCYVEEGWSPKLDESLPSEVTEEQREVRMSTVSWTLRLVEDGEVDDDYPALDRSLTVGKFGADELAVCEATPAQIKQNQSASALLERRVSRQRKQTTTLQTLQPPAIGVGSKQTTLTTPRSQSGNAEKQDPSMSMLQGTPLFPTSLLGLRREGDLSSNGYVPSSSTGASQYGPPIFLRILVTPTKDVRYKTTLQVTSDRYLADVLETICKRRDLGAADKWALVVPDKDIVVPLDRTVESLQGNYDLSLVRRQDLGAEHSGAFTTQSTNPNTSIFKRASQPQPRYQAATKEIASVYKSYTVNRRMPTFLGRHERIFTIDGDWLHIIPTETRAFQTHTATTSYPISSIVSCTQSRLPSSFKLIVLRENDQKRYDFEAENSKIATEIVQEINALLTNVNPIRR